MDGRQGREVMGRGEKGEEVQKKQSTRAERKVFADRQSRRQGCSAVVNLLDLHLTSEGARGRLAWLPRFGA